MAIITNDERRAILAAPDFYRAATEHNRRAQQRAEPGECGGCYGAGKGVNCCICGRKR